MLFLRCDIRFFIPLIVTLFIETTVLTTVALLTQHKSGICDWSCHYPEMCKLGELPFCPQRGPSECLEYFIQDPSVIMDLDVCTFYLVSEGDFHLSLPFYGFFIDEITLGNVSFIEGNQTVTVKFGNHQHVMTPEDTTITLTTDEFNFNPQLSFLVEGTWNNGFSMIYFESLSVRLSMPSFVATFAAIIFVFYFPGMIILYICNLDRILDPADRALLIKQEF